MSERVGVYVCHCGTNISGKVDVKKVVEYAKTIDDVVLAKDYKFMCSNPGQELIVEDIKNEGLTRVVVASCSPLMHEPTFRKACQQAGLNQYLLQMANIREHCSWVTEDPEEATEKAKHMVGGAIQKVIKLKPLTKKEAPVNDATLIVGAGIAGIQAALEIANAGKKVYLVEKGSTIGGHMAKFDKTFPTLDCAACILTPKMVSVAQDPNIELFTMSEVEKVDGFVGNFKVKIKKNPRYVDMDKCTGCGECAKVCPIEMENEFEHGLAKKKAIYRSFPQAIPNTFLIYKTPKVKGKKREGCVECKKCTEVCQAQAINHEEQLEFVDVEVGNIIITTGFSAFDPKRLPQFGYGKLKNVIAPLEFERMNSASGATGGEILMENGEPPKSVAILHCIGSRDSNCNSYCSRVCCMYGLKFAHLLKEKTDAEVYELYIDMRCFGKGYEEFYNRVLEENVRFIRGKAAEVSDFPIYEEENGKLVVRCEDTLAGTVRRIPVDMVVLCAGLEPNPDAKDIARKFSLSCTDGGFFLEKHPKLAPVATNTDGVYIAGCCQGPKDIPDTVAQASAAAASVLSCISKGKVEIEAATAEISSDKCAGCKICLALCAYSAISFNEKEGVSEINEALCKGCGTCAAACPSGAINAKHFNDEQIFSEIEGVLA